MVKLETGLVHVYTGNGKGKTTACLGLALRAIGHGLRVYMVQLMKGRAYGELKAVENNPNFKIIQFGRDEFVNKRNPDRIRHSLQFLLHASIPCLPIRASGREISEDASSSARTMSPCSNVIGLMPMPGSSKDIIVTSNLPAFKEFRANRLTDLAKLKRTSLYVEAPNCL